MAITNLVFIIDAKGVVFSTVKQSVLPYLRELAVNTDFTVYFIGKRRVGNCDWVKADSAAINAGKNFGENLDISEHGEAPNAIEDVKAQLAPCGNIIVISDFYVLSKTWENLSRTQVNIVVSNWAKPIGTNIIIPETSDTKPFVRAAITHAMTLLHTYEHRTIKINSLDL